MAGLNLLLQGKPGVGKTTLVEQVVAELRGPTPAEGLPTPVRESGLRPAGGRLRVAGFTTVEVRDPAGHCLGFRVTTLAGQPGELARIDLRSRVRVGRYGVNLEAFERLVLPELARRDIDLMVIDEIGKMECASGRFRRALEDALDARVNLLATLGIGRLPFFQAVRERPDVELYTLTERNRPALVGEICTRLQQLVPLD
ncbi:MAG: nucleoside-triphosphatase [Terriglobia bacterium]